MNGGKGIEDCGGDLRKMGGGCPEITGVTSEGGCKRVKNGEESV